VRNLSKTPNTVACRPYIADFEPWFWSFAISEIFHQVFSEAETWDCDYDLELEVIFKRRTNKS